MPPNPVSLRQLAPTSEGSDRRLRAAIVEHYDLVWRTLRRLGVAEHSVEDVAQHVLVILSRRIEEVRAGSERAFMLGTAARIASDYRKKQARSCEDLNPEALAAEPSLAPPPDELIDRARARQLLDRVLAEMTDDLRVIFIFFEFEEMSMNEIADLLKLPLGTVASRLRRARVAFETIAANIGDAEGRRRRG